MLNVKPPEPTKEKKATSAKGVNSLLGNEVQSSNQQPPAPTRTKENKNESATTRSPLKLPKVRNGKQKEIKVQNGNDCND
jgi:hypothetical protein